MEEVREKRGLTYGIYSGFSAMQARGPFMINLQTRAELSEGALTLVQDILRDYLANGPTQKELASLGVDILRLYPQVEGMEAIVRHFDTARASSQALPRIGERNGYWHGEPGMKLAG